MHLFVDNLTNVDFSYLDPKRGLVGETWLASIVLEGALDKQGMVCDFGIVKKTLRNWLDDTIDHSLVIAKQSSQLTLKQDDEVIVHHNIFRRFRDIKGKEKNSKNYLSEDVYLVQPDQIYAYKRNNEWKALEGFVFVMPIKETKLFSVDFERPLIGIVKYSNGEFKKNQLIGFRPNSEYEFIIDGQRLYRVPTNSITIKYEYQGNEEEYNPGWAQSS